MRLIKVSIEFVDKKENEELYLKIFKMDDDLMQMINHFHVKEEHIFGYQGESIHKIFLKDVYYFETVEKKVFLYLDKDVYELKEKLYQIEERCKKFEFVRVSKSVIVNVNKIESVYPDIRGRFGAKLTNGERIQISRFYVNDLKAKLGMGS